MVTPNEGGQEPQDNQDYGDTGQESYSQSVAGPDSPRQGQAPTQTQQSGQNQQQYDEPAADDDDEAWDPERARATIRRLREQEREAKRLRQITNEQQQKLRQWEDQQKTDMQRMQDRLAEAEREREQAVAQARESTLRMAVAQEAGRLDIIDPDAAYKLMDMSYVQIDDSGYVSGVEDALKELIKLRPFLKNQNVPKRSGGEFGGNGAQESDLTREKIDDMAQNNPAEYERRRDEIFAWLSRNQR